MAGSRSMGSRGDQLTSPASAKVGKTRGRNKHFRGADGGSVCGPALPGEGRAAPGLGTPGLGHGRIRSWPRSAVLPCITITRADYTHPNPTPPRSRAQTPHWELHPLGLQSRGLSWKTSRIKSRDFSSVLIKSLLLPTPYHTPSSLCGAEVTPTSSGSSF